MIVVDTLRADHLGTYGYQRSTSPNLDRWAARGVVFDRAYSSSSWTLPAFASMYTGQYPARHGAGTFIGSSDVDDGGTTGARGRQRFAVLDTAFPTLAEIFSANGHATGAVLSNPFLDESFGVARGFQEYDYAPHRRAVATVDLALKWIESQGESPFFLMVHLMDVHLPYNPPPEYQGMFADAASTRLTYPIAKVHEVRREIETYGAADRAFVEAAYDEELAYVDSELGRLFDAFEESGLWDDAVVVLTSDHGEEFFEHGGFEHGHAFYDEVVRVPLVVWNGETGRVAEPVSLADLAPTLLASAGVRTDVEFGGASLVPYLSAQPAGLERGLVAEGVLGSADLRAVVLWPNKVIFEDGEATMIFDLEVDPHERRNLIGSTPAMAAVATAAAGLLESPTGALHEAVLDEAVLEQLRDIGYIQ